MSIMSLVKARPKTVCPVEFFRLRFGFDFDEVPRMARIVEM